MREDDRIARRRIGSAGLAGFALSAVLAAGCAGEEVVPEADLILHGGRVYTLTWDDPGGDGTPAEDAPFDGGSWQPDATAVAIRRGTLVWVGDEGGAMARRGEHTRVVDLEGATVLPGLVDAHTHVVNLGATLEQVDLVGASSEEEAVERVAERVAARAAAATPGEWIVAYGWDDGAWADDYPDKALLTERVPDHPVLMRGLHGFAVWGNQAALDLAGITATTPEPPGGTIDRDAAGEPTGLLRDRATALLEDAVPPPDVGALERRWRLGLEEMASSGYTAVHEAGVDRPTLAALENLAAERALPVRVYAMLSARDVDLLADWRRWGPDVDGNDRLLTRSVKAFYDGALGSRGARLLDDYSDMPGHFGVSGAEYGFDEEAVRGMMAAGFQVAIHAIGDAANRATLDFLADAYGRIPGARDLRNRIEHAQVIHPYDLVRFARLDVIASMQPGHAVEDKAWAEQRLGSFRVLGAYAWRMLRERGVQLVFSSDLPGSDHDPFYGLHSAVTRRDRDGRPEGGWHPQERMTIEEAVRGYTRWAARASFLEDSAGMLLAGLWADLTVVDTDPFTVAREAPERLLEGAVLMTIVDGEIVYER